MKRSPWSWTKRHAAWTKCLLPRSSKPQSRLSLEELRSTLRPLRSVMEVTRGVAHVAEGLSRKKPRRLVEQAEPVEGPIHEHGFPVNVFAFDGSPVAAVVGGVAMVAHHVIFIRPQGDGGGVVQV